MLTFSELEIMVLMKIKNVFFKLCLHKKKKNTYCSNYRLGILAVNFSR